jgi:hypothetical protein
MKKMTFDEVLKSGGFKYKGKEEDLYAAINAFGLDDYQEYDNTYQPKGKIYFLGVKFLFAHLLVWSAMALLANFFPMIGLRRSVRTYHPLDFGEISDLSKNQLV